MKAIAYCRVSTADQENEEGSLEMQKKRIGAWCAAYGFELEAVFSESVCGMQSTRHELQNALSLACKLKAVLVVYSLHRLARSVKDILQITDQLERSGAALSSIYERLETTSSVGKIVIEVLSRVSEFESDQLSARSEHALGCLRKANRRISHKIPYGYDLVSDGVTIEANEQEQSVITKIVGWRSSGSSYREIARKLTVLGIQTKESRVWHPATIRGIINRHGKISDESEAGRATIHHENRS